MLFCLSNFMLQYVQNYASSARIAPLRMNEFDTNMLS